MFLSGIMKLVLLFIEEDATKRRNNGAKGEIIKNHFSSCLQNHHLCQHNHLSMSVFLYFLRFCRQSYCSNTPMRVFVSRKCWKFIVLGRTLSFNNLLFLNNLI